MYSRQNRNPRADVSVDLPRDYSGSAFSPFQNFPPEPHAECHEPEHREECREEEKCEEKCECAVCEQKPPQSSLLGGLSGLLGGNIGLEELLLLGVIFLIFSDDSLRDNELLICLLLILFI
ncbi:MAG: hypothetical protein J6S71_07290 [Clostridia bacterium]|nr:hypothetical protein [Clostridia bacterium]